MGMRWHWYWPYSSPRRGLRLRLSALGIGWATSPLRKLAQAISLVLFLAIFLWVLWPYRHDAAGAFARREIIAAESFLALDPLVGISTAIAARMWVWSLTWAAAMLAASMLVPRLFCGYVCPLGTCIDLADWAVGRHVRRWHLPAWGRWSHLKYALLLAVLASSLAGVTLSGFIAPIPLLTRGLAFLIGPLQLRAVLGPDFGSLPSAEAAAAIALLAAVLATTLLGRRFWCRICCPTGAMLALATRWGLARRQVTERCTECGSCEAACSFGAIRSDRTTRSSECTFCQQCGGACPTAAIEFVGRFDRTPSARSPTMEAAGQGLTRRAIFMGAAGGFLGGIALAGAIRRGPDAGTAAAADSPVRPPGSLPEPGFLAACVRCGSCIKGCPTGVLVPMGCGRGFERLWTPHLDADRAGCAPDCNVCGQTCPTGAIRALPLAEKRAVHVGCAEVSEATCLPHARTGQCRLCMDACHAAGYDAIEFILVGVETDASGLPLEGTGDLAPAVIPGRCVGCGLCQTMCQKVNVRQSRLLGAAAIIIRAGAGRDDRIARGSYLALRAAEPRHAP